MKKQAEFTMKLAADLRDEFVAEAEAAGRPASQIMRKLMRESLHRQRGSRAYEAFLGDKVAPARASMREGRGRSDEAVESDAAARRTALRRQAGENPAQTPREERAMLSGRPIG